MKQKKSCVAMLLAGGQGSRLYVLTNSLAKPGVTFGGKYKIIDFPLSNCVNSYIDTVGVLTQYQPLLLNEYIGNGQPWDLDRSSGGVRILPPYQQKAGTDWYRGTANAIYQNLSFIDQYDPDYVLVLSGDHIYKMNYNDMLKTHRETGADATIAVLNVTLEEASRFGIMNTNPDGSIYEFEEKPANPKSTKASMGIYIFNYKTLKKFLTDDDKDPASQNDFGKNIIPKMLNSGLKLQTYEFDGYWKDVGTVDSLWQANMDLLGENPTLDLDDPNWKIYSRNDSYPPLLVGNRAHLVDTIATEGCEVNGTVKHSVLSNSVIIEEGAEVIDSVLFEGAIVEKGAKVYKAILDRNSRVKSGVVIGGDSKITVLGNNVVASHNVDEGIILEEDN